MKRKTQFTYFLVLFFISTTLASFAQSDSRKAKNKFLPNVLRTQYAGNAGMFSIGADWLFANDKLEFAASIGFIPASRSTKQFYSSTYKLMYTPKWRYDHNQFQWKPLSVGPIFSRYSGLDLSRYQNTNYYPKGYYWWGIKNRLGLGLSTEVKMNLKKGPIKAVSWYLESSIWDVYFYSVFANGNESYLSPTDLVVMGTGIKIQIK